MKIIKKLLTISFILIILILNNNVYAAETEISDYSEKYKQWLELSDQEKENTIAPLPFNVRNNSQKSILQKARVLLKTISIPSKFDLRDEIYVEVKDQMETGQCWAFTANTSVETNLALQGEVQNFSERHLEYATANIYDKNEYQYSLNRELGEGAFASTAFTYYSNGSGPILEEDMPFENNEIEIPFYELPTNIATKKVDNMIYFPNIYKRMENGELIYEDANGIGYSESEVKEIRNSIKQHIMNYGAISASVYSPNDCYNKSTYAANCNLEETYTNHGVTIIGWDDSFRKENFINQPNSDGAYIVLNSWGTDWGENGVYYVSYEDFLIESGMRGVISVSDIEYDNLYQHDVSEMAYTLQYRYAANVFECIENEVLTEVMIGALSEQTCNIYINQSNDNLNVNNLTKVASNVTLKPGYNTIKMSDEIKLNANNKFAIVVEITSTYYSGIGIEYNDGEYFEDVISNSNESFVSEDGVNWYDIYNPNNMMNLSIKAYTKTENKSFEVSETSGKGYENVGGFFSFSVETSYIEEGNVIDIVIYKGEENITEQFGISGNIVKGNGAFITIQCPTNITSGEYIIKATLANYESVNRNFLIETGEGTIITAQFNDEIFFDYVRNKMENYIQNRTELKIIAEKEEFENITNMKDAYAKGITDITGIEYFTNLQILNLNFNNVYDLSPLSNLKNLQELHLGFNGFIDTSPLNNLTQMRILEFCFNNINNLDFLNNMSELQALILQCSAPEQKIDISSILGLENLVILNLDRWLWITEEDLKDISKLNNLKYLSLISCDIGKLDFLSNLSLNYLYVGNNSFKHTITEEYYSGGTNHFVELSPISNMSTLIELSLDGIKGIEDLNQLQNLTNLKSLSFCEGNLRDATILDSEIFKENITWSSLWLNSNEITDEIFIDNDDYMIINVPPIVEQSCNENSLLYSSEGVYLEGCEWNEYGKSIKINPKEEMTSIIIINSGYAMGSSYTVKLVKKELVQITISNPPDKTEYFVGESFDKVGMEVTATYNDGSEKIVTDYIVDDGDMLAKEQNSVTISYTENSITKTTTQKITVTGSLEIDFGIYEEKEEYITKITPGTTLKDIQENIITNGEVEIYKETTQITELDTKLQTGMTIKIILNNEEMVYTIVVTGDLNGDGEDDFTDMVILNSCRLGKNILKGEYLEAGDINRDETIDFVDLVKLNSFRLGKIKEL